jgi:hypothetical protein
VRGRRAQCSYTGLENTVPLAASGEERA